MADAPNDAPNAPISLANQAAFTVFKETILADVDGVVNMLRDTEAGQQLVEKLLNERVGSDSAGVRRALQHKYSDTIAQISRADLQVSPTFSNGARAGFDDVVRLVECTDGVEDITLGNIRLSEVPAAVFSVMEGAYAALRKNPCEIAVLRTDVGGDARAATRLPAVQRAYDGSIMITPEALMDAFKESIDGALDIDQYTDLARLFELDLDEYQDEDAEEDEALDNIDSAAFLEAVGDKAEEELRGYLEDLNQLIEHEHKEMAWYKNANKTVKCAPKRDRAGKVLPASDVKTGKWVLDPMEMPVYERRPIFTILYDSNNW